MSCDQSASDTLADPYDATRQAWGDGPGAGSEGALACEEDVHESRCCNAVCALAYTSFVLGSLELIGHAAEMFMGHVALRILKITVLLNCLVNVAGLGMLDRSQSSCRSRGCQLCPCNRLYIPWLLIFLGATDLSLSILGIAFFSFEGEDLQWDMVLGGVVSCVNALLMIAFGSQWFYSNRKITSCPSSHNAGSSSDVDTVPSKTRFAASMSQDGRKYELIYIVAEAICIATVGVYRFLVESDSDDRGEHVNGLLAIHITVTPFCLMMRVHRYCNTHPTGAIVSGMGTLLDTFVFTWNAVAAALIGHTAVTSFIVNILLTYSVITFLPFWRAAVVVPVCYVAYCVAAVIGDTLAWSELLLLGVGLGINLAAKKMIETSKYELFSLLEERGRQAVHEKVLRFQAEFEKDNALSGIHAKRTSEKSSYFGHQYPKPGNRVIVRSDQTRGESLHVHCPPSVHSAPTLLLGSDSKNAPFSTRANCLPTEALVWLEGEALPRQLSNIEVGHRILCYDRLGGHLKHAAVSEMQEVGGAVIWNTVTLTDGTTLKLTADHPVQPVPAATNRPGMTGPWNTTAPVESRDLRPGLDSLLVLKVSPIEVLSVELEEEVGTRIALSVQQPERHAIFVAPARQPGGCLQTMAVESNSLADRRPLMIGADKTFLSFHDASCGDTHAQSQSAPGSLCGPASGAAAQDHRQETAPPSEPRSMSSFSESGSSAKNSQGSAEVIVCGPVSTGDGPPSSSGTMIALSSVLSLGRAGWKSVGSSSHASGTCKPCAFENRRQFESTKPCTKGALCEFCHEPHAHDVKKMKRQRSRGTKREAWTNESATTSRLE